MAKLDVVAVITAVGGLITAILNYLHGRDDAGVVRDLKTAIMTQADHTAQTTKSLNSAFTDTRKMLRELISALKR